MKVILTGLLSLCALIVFGATARAADADQSPVGKPIRVTIYPILIKAPIFGASVDFPSLPSVPGGGGGSGGGSGGESGDLSGSTDTSLNAAYMAGVLVEANRWFVEASGTYAAVSASRTTPRVNIDSKSSFYTIRGGVRLLGGFSATGGVRHVSSDLDATLDLPNLGRTLEGRAKPGLWDPLIGVDWRRDMGSWTIDANVQGGGFGVGTDVDISSELNARWRVFRHVELRAGYSLIHFKMTVADVSIGSFQRTLVARQTLHGPLIGLGIVF